MKAGQHGSVGHTHGLERYLHGQTGAARNPSAGSLASGGST
jgi:hypothetical protein